MPRLSTSRRADRPAVRVRLDLALTPTEAVRRLRGASGLVALIGAWHHAEALIAFDPITRTRQVADIDRPHEAWGWLGVWDFDGSVDVGLYRSVLTHQRGRWFLESAEPVDPGPLLALLSEDAPAEEFVVSDFEFVPEPAVHRARVARAIEHLRDGDLFQVNLCAGVEATFEGYPLDAFCRGVEHLHPTYAAFVSRVDGSAVASFSPELFVRRTGLEVLTSPIKGTAPLSAAPDALVASAKNRAENVMIVDLMRNDLGRVAQPGSVRVPALTRLEKHAVWHLVSDVVAHLDPAVSDVELLAATFPPGSVTGAPKERAIEIIGELESAPRRAYTGAIGYAGSLAGLELNVVIRTLEFSDNRVWLGVGGGIVVDSDPDSEFVECLVKARPIVEAVGGRLRDTVPEVEPGPAAAQTGREAHLVDVAQGIFDTLLVRDGVPVNVAAHVARLDASVRSVYGVTVRSGLETAIRSASRGKAGEQRLRIDARPHGGDVQVTLSLAPLDPETAPWRLEPRVVPGGMGEHKWADRRALATDGAEPLLLDTDGSVLESARASVFVVLDDGLHTPPLDGRILPGTGRARLIETAQSVGLPVFQRRLTLADVAAATEVFVVNALRGVVAVSTIDGLGEFAAPGPVTAWLADAAPSAEANPHSLGERPAMRPRVLVVDNHDSFVYNLVQYVRELGAETVVIRNDDPIPDPAEFTHVIISPGPGSPVEAGNSREVIERFGALMPVLGVCLGHQVMGELLGGRVVRALDIGEPVVHGKASLVHHDGTGVHTGLPSPLVCARYHSLVVVDLPESVQITARTGSGIVMGLAHGNLLGVQAHPESILTSHGHAMIANFLSVRPIPDPPFS